MNTINFKHLEKNISDTIFEGLIKIGYVEHQRIRIYYDRELLIELLNITQDDNLENGLVQFKESVNRTLGNIIISKLKGRYEFIIPEEGIHYIYENNESRGFLKELIGALNRQSCTMEEILQVFKKESPDITVEEMNSGEFQYVVSFNDTSIDEFKYCFTFDEMGHYYHRLLEYDFNRL